MNSLRFYIQIDHETVEYKADLAYLVPEVQPPWHEPLFNNNHDFEMDIESAMGGGWVPVSGADDSIMNIVDASPSGYQHLKVLPPARGIKYDLTDIITDITQPIEVIHYSKFTGFAGMGLSYV